MENKNCTLKLEAVHPDTVLKIITTLKNTKSCGTDKIVIELAKHELLPAITHIINYQKDVSQNNGS